MMASEAVNKAEKKATNFNVELDILLLRETITVNPYAEDSKVKETAKWTQIHGILNSTLKNNEYLTLRQRTDRMKKLLQKFKANEMASLRASGASEEFTERDRLLTDLENVIEEEKIAKAEAAAEVKKQYKDEKDKQEKKAAEDEKVEQGREIRETALAGLKKKPLPQLDDEDEEEFLSPPSKIKRGKKNEDLTGFLKEKNQNDIELKKAELAFRREKLELENKRAELENKRAEQDAERNKQMFALMTALITRPQMNSNN